MNLGVAVIGMGFMGRTHVRAYRDAGEGCRIVGLYDIDAHRLRGDADEAGNINTGSDEDSLFDPSGVYTTDSLDALLSRDDIDAVSVCTPTDTHADVALAALRAGKHVLVEKPVSLVHSEIETLAAEAERVGRICMPAMCIRFWPQWEWLAETIGTGTLGPVRSLWFERFGSAPSWGGGFYQDPARCGGALHDLHIHDTDFICHVLGQPEAVTSVGKPSRLTTMYHFEGGPAHVVASGGWPRGGAGFRMRYVAEFERGTADFDIALNPSLSLTRVGDEASSIVQVSKGTGYDGEIRAFLDAVASDGPAPVTIGDATTTLRVLEAEARSLESGRRESVVV